MNILYISRSCSKKKFSTLRGITTCAAQKYNSLLAKGLKVCGADVCMVSSPPVYYDKKKWIPHEREYEDGVLYRYTSLINLPLLRNLSSFIDILFYILHNKKANTVIICDTLHISATLAACIAGHIKRVPVIGIVTDIPGCSLSDHELKIGDRAFRFVTQLCSGFLFLTKQMEELIDVKDKPVLVMEGHVDAEMGRNNICLEDKDKERICLFAGNLDNVNGLHNLIDGFIMADIDGAYLDIYGSGKDEQEIVDRANENPHIRYKGNVPNEVIVKAEQKATLLINPRPSEQIFTKYSFPSKNLEYMASGTPLLTTRLPGIPEDQLPYLFLIEDETSKGIAEAIEKVFRHTSKELYEFGAKAKEYVLKEKSNTAQAKRLISFVRLNYGIE